MTRILQVNRAQFLDKTKDFFDAQFHREESALVARSRGRINSTPINYFYGVGILASNLRRNRRYGP